MIRAGGLAAFVAGAWLAQRQAELPDTSLLLAAAALAGAALALSLRLLTRARQMRSRAVGGALVLLAGSAGAGAAYASWQAHVRLADELAFEHEGRDVVISGVIASLPALLERGTRFEFDVQAVAARDMHVPAHISLAWFGGGAEVKPGERWRFNVRLRRPHGTLNPHGFDLEAWMLERNLRATGYVRETSARPERLAEMVWRPGYAVDRLRHLLRARLQERLHDTRYGGVLIALILGDQRAIGEDDWLLFNRTGISHLVSISGLHITMIAGLVGWGVARLWRRSPRALALAPAQSAAAMSAMLAAWGYCMLAGWGIPAQRTFFMLATVACALWLRLATQPATTLALAAALVTLLDPWAVLAAGFWLSFGAVAAIFFCLHGRPEVAAPTWRPHLREAARVQLVVTVALLPLSVVLFQQVSVIGPIANAVAIPLVSLLVTPLALVGACFVALPEPLASVAVPLLAIAHALFALLGALLQWFVSWPAASIALPAPEMWAAALALLGAAWLLAPPGWPLRWAGLIWLLPLCLWPPERPRPGELWVTAFDVGQGSALLVEAAGHVLVYDTGPRYSPQADAGSRILLPYLRARGIARVDVLVISHLDGDHSGGAQALLRSLAIGEIWTSIDPEHPLLRGARPVRRCLAEEGSFAGSLEMRLLHPTPREYALPARNTNARSCVVEVRLGVTRVLLTGDLPAEQEAHLLKRTPEHSRTLVTAPHHGSRNSSSEPFVRAIAPSWVAVQAGYRNRFGHPDAGVVARYGALGANVVRSDFAGATQWRFDRAGIALPMRQRSDRPRYWHNRPGRDRVPETSPFHAPAPDNDAGREGPELEPPVSRD